MCVKLAWFNVTENLSYVSTMIVRQIELIGQIIMINCTVDKIPRIYNLRNIGLNNQYIN